MSLAEIVHWFAVIGASGGLSLYLAHHYPSMYLRWYAEIAWSIHALALSFIFGIGVVIGLYRHSGDVINPMWIGTHVTLVTLLYMGILLYHDFLRTIAEGRKGRLRKVQLAYGAAFEAPGVES
jgi:hypothetical protein